jgi:hypothetical protein
LLLIDEICTLSRFFTKNKIIISTIYKPILSQALEYYF